MSSKPRVLIADDAVFIREILAEIVRKAGFAVVGEATNGQEAIELVVAAQPDVVLMDIVMPIKSGIQATKEVLKEYPETKIIALSTEGSESMVIQAIEAGCVSHIVKPFESSQVIEAIESALIR